MTPQRGKQSELPSWWQPRSTGPRLCGWGLIRIPAPRGMTPASKIKQARWVCASCESSPPLLQEQVLIQHDWRFKKNNYLLDM